MDDGGKVLCRLSGVCVGKFLCVCLGEWVSDGDAYVGAVGGFPSSAWVGVKVVRKFFVYFI